MRLFHPNRGFSFARKFAVFFKNLALRFLFFLPFVGHFYAAEDTRSTWNCGLRSCKDKTFYPSPSTLIVQAPLPFGHMNNEQQQKGLFSNRNQTEALNFGFQQNWTSTLLLSNHKAPWLWNYTLFTASFWVVMVGLSDVSDNFSIFFCRG